MNGGSIASGVTDNLVIQSSEVSEGFEMRRIFSSLPVGVVEFKEFEQLTQLAIRKTGNRFSNEAVHSQELLD